MKRIALPLCLALALALVSTQAFALPVTWTLGNVTFDDNTAATGSFVYDASTDAFSAIDIAVKDGTLSAHTYTGDGFFLGSSLRFVFTDLDFSTTGTRYLSFMIASGLTDAGGAVALVAGNPGNSYECSNCTLIRYITGGSLAGTPEPPPSAVPEPTSLLLLGTGLVGISTRIRTRRKQATA